MFCCVREEKYPKYIKCYSIIGGDILLKLLTLSNQLVFQSPIFKKEIQEYPGLNLLRN